MKSASADWVRVEQGLGRRFCNSCGFLSDCAQPSHDSVPVGSEGPVSGRVFEASPSDAFRYEPQSSELDFDCLKIFTINNVSHQI